MATSSVTIQIYTNNLISKIRRNLAIIGKRAKTTAGASMYSDITTSAAEEPIFDDLLMFGAQNIAANLADICKVYTETDTTDSNVDANIIFTFVAARIDTSDSTKNIIKGLVFDYLYNFVISRYLAAIHPSTGDKYPPIFAKTYSEACETIIIHIRSVAFLKRPKDKGSISYGLVGLKGSTTTDDDGNEVATMDYYYTKSEVDALILEKFNELNEAKQAKLSAGAKISIDNDVISSDLLVINNLESDSTTDSLSAKQGSVLDGKIGTLETTTSQTTTDVAALSTSLTTLSGSVTTISTNLSGLSDTTGEFTDEEHDDVCTSIENLEDILGDVESLIEAL